MGPVPWPSYAENGSTEGGGGGGGGSGGGGGGDAKVAMVINDEMEFELVSDLRGARCDYWDTLFPLG